MGPAGRRVLLRFIVSNIWALSFRIAVLSSAAPASGFPGGSSAKMRDIGGPAPAQSPENIKNSPARGPMAKGRRLLSVQKCYIYQLSISQSFWKLLMISVVLILPKTGVFLFLLKGFCQIIKRRHTAASPAKGADIVPLVGIGRPGNIQMEPRKALCKALQE